MKLSRWSKSTFSTNAEWEWYLHVTKPHLHRRGDPYRARISTALGADRMRALEMWNPYEGAWEEFAQSTNLKALKAIGRLEAARRLHV
jgi:hypothetical protein